MSKEPDPLAGNARDDWNDWRDEQGVYPTALNPPAKHYANGGHLVYPKAQHWVGLTDDEVDKCYESVMFNPDIEPTRVLVYQAIEAALRSKNENRN